jgi:hypothetical protein
MSETETPEPGPLSNAKFSVVSKPVEITTTIRGVVLQVERNGEMLDLITMSVAAAKNLRGMLDTAISFEDQLPAEEASPLDG